MQLVPTLTIPNRDIPCIHIYYMYNTTNIRVHISHLIQYAGAELSQYYTTVAIREDRKPVKISTIAVNVSDN